MAFYFRARFSAVATASPSPGGTSKESSSIVFFWGVWHGMMQTYGFCRIYDAKTGSFAALTRRLDFATCAIWFATAVLLSPQRMADTLETYYASGVPVHLADSALHNVQQRLLLRHRDRHFDSVSGQFCPDVGAGKTPEPGEARACWKRASHFGGIATTASPTFSLASRCSKCFTTSNTFRSSGSTIEPGGKRQSIGGFMRFVFRRSGSLVGLYIGLVFAYGSHRLVQEDVEIDTVKRVLTGMVAASGLLHFYYDGFIWKVRERFDTRVARTCWRNR